MAKYRLFQRDSTTGHVEVVAEYECASDFDALYVAKKHKTDDDMLICDDDLRIVRHASTSLH